MAARVSGPGSGTPAPTPAATPAKPGSTDKAAAPSFTARLAKEMKRIASHASKIDTLKNGAKLYHLTNGRLVEQVEGKTPYVVKAGTAPKQAAATPAETATTTTPSGTTGSTSSTAAATGSDATKTNAQLQADLAAARAAAAQSGLKE